MHDQSYDGLQSNIREMKTPSIETWKNEYSDKDYTIEVTTPEFTTICPQNRFARLWNDSDCLYPRRAMCRTQIVERVFSILPRCRNISRTCCQ